MDGWVGPIPSYYRPDPNRHKFTEKQLRAVTPKWADSGPDHALHFVYSTVSTGPLWFGPLCLLLDVD